MVTLVPWAERQWCFALPLGAFPAVLERLVGTPARATALVAGRSDESLAQRIYSKWSVKEHLGHLADMHALDRQRIDQFVAGVPVLAGADMSNQRTDRAGHGSTPI